MGYVWDGVASCSVGGMEGDGLSFGFGVSPLGVEEVTGLVEKFAENKRQRKSVEVAEGAKMVSTRNRTPRASKRRRAGDKVAAAKGAHGKAVDKAYLVCGDSCSESGTGGESSGGSDGSDTVDDVLDPEDWECSHPKLVKAWDDAHKSAEDAASESKSDECIVKHEDGGFILVSTGEIVGRVTEMNAGEAKHSFQLYCRLHQCPCMVTARRWPGSDKVCGWFAAGVRLGKGKEHKSEHKRLWSSLC